MDIYAVVLAIPGKVGKEIGALRKRYAGFMDYSIVPHITLAPLFTTPSESSLIYQKLDKAAQKITPFNVRLNRVRYFEVPNNVAYVAIADTRPIFALNRAIARALKGLVTASVLKGLTIAEQPLLFDVKTFVPHATIAEHIPEERLVSVKSDLAAVEIDHIIRVRSFSLFLAKEDEKPQVWRRASVHLFGSAPR